MAKTASRNLTTGSPTRLVIGFLLPLLGGLLFQQLYNMVDTLVVGRFLRHGRACWASARRAPSIFWCSASASASATASSSPWRRNFGEGDEAELRRFVANSIWLSAAFAVVLTVATALLCTPVLRWMNTPDNIFRYAYDYIFVIFLGIPAIILYNLVSGVIRSLGDSRTPIYFLVLSSLLNVALDLLAVAVLGMGVEGPAWATVISQAISGLLCLAIMGKRYPVLRFRPGELRPSRTHITRLFAIGVPMGLQYSVTAIGTIVVQTAVNGLGAVSIAAVTAANKVSQLFTCPFDAAGTTMAVYGGQNYGAMKLDRIHRGVRACVLLMFAYSALGLGVLALFGGKLSLLFLDSAESAAVRDQIGLLAQQFLVWNASCYFLLTLVNVLRFLIQGVGFTQQAVFAGGV